MLSSSSLTALQMALALVPLPVSSTLSLVTMAVCSDLHCILLKSATGCIFGKRASTSRAVQGRTPQRAFCAAMRWKRAAGPAVRLVRSLAFLALEAALCLRSFASRSGSGSTAVRLSVALRWAGLTACAGCLMEVLCLRVCTARGWPRGGTSRSCSRPAGSRARPGACRQLGGGCASNGHGSVPGCSLLPHCMLLLSSH
jgi:hypothetical protein